MDNQAGTGTGAAAGKAAAPAPKEPTAAPAAEGAAPVAEAPESTAARVRRWMDENLAGGPVARDVECWNAVHDAIPALVAIIDG